MLRGKQDPKNPIGDLKACTWQRVKAVDGVGYRSGKSDTPASRVAYIKNSKKCPSGLSRLGFVLEVVDWFYYFSSIYATN